jgi:ABC-type branched-subunit amino acid transport system substrate-binding protein
MRARRLHGAVAIGAMLMTLSLAACGGSDDDKGSGSDTVTIGDLGMQTGAGAGQGVFTKGLQMGVDDVNASGVLKDAGITLKVDSQDVASDPTHAVTTFNKLVQSGASIVTSSGFTPIAQAIDPLANKAKVPFITGAAAGTEDSDFEFHLYDLLDGTVNFVKSQTAKGSTKFATVVDTSNDSMSAIGGLVAKTASENGASVVANETVGGDDSDFSAVLTKLKNADVQAIYLGMLEPQMANFLRQMKDDGSFDGVIGFFIGGLDEHLAEVAGNDAVDGIVNMIVPWSAGTADATSAAFEKEWTDKYQTAPATYPALGYHVAWIIAAAVEQAAAKGKVTGDSIRAEIPAASTSDMVKEHGLIPDFVINADGHTTYPGSVATYDEGKIVPASN